MQASRLGESATTPVALRFATRYPMDLGPRPADLRKRWEAGRDERPCFRWLEAGMVFFTFGACSSGG